MFKDDITVMWLSFWRQGTVAIVRLNRAAEVPGPRPRNVGRTVPISFAGRPQVMASNVKECHEPEISLQELPVQARAFGAPVPVPAACGSPVAEPWSGME